MRTLLTLFVCILMASCGASTAGPLTEAEVSAVVAQTLVVLDSGIEREDPFLASQTISDRFTMGNNIAVRYTDGNFEGRGQGAFRTFFQNVFNLHANILHETTIDSVELVGDVATLAVTVDFNSLRVDKTPPENFTAQATDYMVFIREGGAWLLLNWAEVPPPAEPEPEPEPGEGEGEGEAGA